jgi:hypothetical protein
MKTPIYFHPDDDHFCGACGEKVTEGYIVDGLLRCFDCADEEVEEEKK